MPIRRCRMCPACSRRANVRRVLHGANRLGGNSLSDLLVFGKRAGEYAASLPRKTGRQVNPDQIETAARRAVEPFERDGEIPYQVQQILQEMMQDLVGIVRREEEMQRALTELGQLKTARGEGQPLSEIANTTAAGTLLSICRTCSPFPRSSPAPPSSAKKAAERISAKIILRKTMKRAAVSFRPSNSSGRNASCAGALEGDACRAQANH